MATKTIPQRLTIKQRRHLREMGIPATLKGIQAQVDHLKLNYNNVYQGCSECADIAHRLKIATN